MVVSFHIPVFDEPHFDSFKDEDRERLFKLLGEFPHTLSLSGHTHFQKHHFFDKEQGWPRDEPHHHYNVGTTSGDWYSGTPDEAGIPPALMRDGTPKGYAYIEFSGNEYTIDYKVANKPADYRMSIHAPKVVPHNEGYKGQITVNFFQGSEKSTLEYRVDDGDWHAMSRQETPDPALLAISYEWDYADELPEGRRPSQAVASSHIWKSGIPTNLPVGDHTIEVRATDMFGRVHTGTQQYKIVEREEKLVR